MSITTIVYMVLGGGFFLGVFLAVVVFAGVRRSGAEAVPVGILLLVSSVNMVHPHLSLLFPEIDSFGDFRLFEPTQFLVAPLLFLPIRQRLTGKGPHMKDLLHGLPAAVILVMSFLPASRELENSGGYPLFSIILWVILIEQAAVYLWSASISHAKLRNSLFDRFSNVQGKDEAWVRWFLRLYLVVNLSYVLPLAALIHSSDVHLPRAMVTLEVSILIWVLGFRILTEDRSGSSGGYRTPVDLLPPADSALLVRALHEQMERHEAFRNPDLGLDDLVKSLGFSRNEISWAINKKIGKNFYQFVNEYRVQSVARLLADPERRETTILESAFEAGFNSKPVFQKIFKQVTGLTPSQYRNQHRTDR